MPDSGFSVTNVSGLLKKTPDLEKEADSGIMKQIEKKITVSVLVCDSGRRGHPLGVASRHRDLTVGAELDRVTPGICINVSAEDESRVLAVNADPVAYDIPPGDGNVHLLQSERCLKVNLGVWCHIGAFKLKKQRTARKTHHFCAAALFL